MWKQINIKFETYEKLIEIRDSKSLNSLDTVIRSLLGEEVKKPQPDIDIEGAQEVKPVKEFKELQNPEEATPFTAPELPASTVGSGFVEKFEAKIICKNWCKQCISGKHKICADKVNCECEA